MLPHSISKSKCGSRLFRYNRHVRVGRQGCYTGNQQAQPHLYVSWCWHGKVCPLPGSPGSLLLGSLLFLTSITFHPSKVDGKRLKSAVEGLVSGAYTVTVTRHSEEEIRSTVRNGDGREYGVALTEG